jgi:homoserine kinase
MTGPSGTTFTVRVPATSANLGPGFDCVALALDLYDEVTITAGDPAHGDAVEVAVSGEGADHVARDGTNLVARAVQRALDAAGAPRPPLRLSCSNRIPHGRGLGSSAAAVVTGLVAGRAIAGPAGLDDETLLGLATEMEGHPDNAAAALLGGLTLAWADDVGAAAPPRVHAVRLEPRTDLRVTVLVPRAGVPTTTARALLPDTVPHADATTNAGRSALLVAGLTGVPGVLLAATEDRLHQTYRAPAMPESAAVLRSLRADGRAAVISGAGPSVLVIDEGEPAPFALPENWRVLPVGVAPTGAEVLLR